VDEEMNQDKTGEADEMNLEVDPKDEVMSNLRFSSRRWLEGEKE